MTFFQDLQARGLVHDFTDQPEFLQALEAGGMRLYCGFDPTAESLHVGSLMPIVGLMRFQRAGHRPIALVGGATGMIGDPSGKSEERNLLDRETLEKNIAGIRNQLSHFLDIQSTAHSANLLDYEQRSPDVTPWHFDLFKKNLMHRVSIFRYPQKPEWELLNNADWFKNTNLIDFLRDIGKHFPIGYMMAKESVKNRISSDAGISYTEFSYMLLQAYDFLHLFKTKNCTLQIGGSDQWGNITSGIELIRRVYSKPAYGITFPLITTSDGRKFGKTEAGNVWLDSKRTSPYRFYQYWVQTDDRDIERFLKYFSFLTLEEIGEVVNEHSRQPEKRAGQHFLAHIMTSIVHDEEAALSAGRASRILFGGSVVGISEADLLAAAEEMPKTERRGALPLSLVDALVETRLSSSKGMARKDIQGGGVYVNNRRAGEEGAALSQNDLLFGKYVLLRKGKKNYHLLQFQQ